jgi:hypothetical protein
VQCSAAQCSAAAIARSDCSSGDGRRMVRMDGGGWIVVNGPLPLREASPHSRAVRGVWGVQRTARPSCAVRVSAAHSRPGQCSGAQRSAVASACRDCLVGDGWRIVIMDGGGGIVVKSPLGPREASRRAVQRAACRSRHGTALPGPARLGKAQHGKGALCGGMEWNAMECNAVRRSTVQCGGTCPLRSLNRGWPADNANGRRRMDGRKWCAATS